MDPDDNDRIDDYISFIQQVKDGYDEVAPSYRAQKDEYQIQLPPYISFKSALPENAKVVELGCASGYPVGKDLLKSGYSYTGIDLSNAQIRLAKEENPEYKDHFLEYDMLQYLKTLDDNSVDAVLSLFTIFHIPRSRHVDLFVNIKRVLSSEGIVLFTAALSNWEGIEEDWFGARMVWSNFSYEFYRVMLKELGFVEKMCYLDTRTFQGKNESTYYLLYRLKL